MIKKMAELFIKVAENEPYADRRPSFALIGKWCAISILFTILFIPAFIYDNI